MIIHVHFGMYMALFISNPERPYFPPFFYWISGRLPAHIFFKQRMH